MHSRQYLHFKNDTTESLHSSDDLTFSGDASDSFMLAFEEWLHLLLTFLQAFPGWSRLWLMIFAQSICQWFSRMHHLSFPFFSSSNSFGIQWCMACIKYRCPYRSCLIPFPHHILYIVLSWWLVQAMPYHSNGSMNTFNFPVVTKLNFQRTVWG